MLSHEKVNDETGRPMHKSWGNAIWFDDAVESMGADVMRWMYATQTPAQNLSFGYGPAEQVKRRLLTLWNSYAFFVTYARIDDYRPSYGMLASGPEGDALQPLDRWLLARTQQMVEECRAALDAYDSPRLVRAVESQIDDQSTGTSGSPAGASGRTRTTPASARRTTRCGTHWCSCVVPWRR